MPVQANWNTSFPIAENYISVAQGSGAGVFGSWVTIVSSTACDVGTLQIFIDSLGNGYFGTVNIGIGAAGSEQIVIPNLIFDACASVWEFPLEIPAGTRIAAQYAASAASGYTAFVGVCYCEGGPIVGAGISAFDAIGIVSNETGTPVNSASSANTYGAWTQITGSASNDYYALLLMVDTELNTAAQSAGKIQIGVGASGSEVMLFDAKAFQGYHEPTAGVLPVMIPKWFQVPAGTRIAARFQSANSSQTTIGCSLIGLR